MKKINIFALGLMLAAGFSSCEMADELRGNDSSTEAGVLDLSLMVPEVKNSRAETVSTDNFEVVITDTENPENVHTYIYSEQPELVLLPVGTYTVEAHTSGEMETEMTEPYFGGEEPLTITSGVTSQVEVVCKMQNTKIDMAFSEDFKSTFKDWNITLDDGSEHVLTFSTASSKASEGVVYWALNEEVTTMTMNIDATTTEGVRIQEQKQFTKADAEESYDDDTQGFGGGDALDITIDIDENTPSGDEQQPQISFDINVDITFSDTNETVEIPVVDVTEPEDPDQPVGGDKPTMTMPGDGHIVYTLNGGDQPASADVIINAPKGLKSMNVKIVAGNDGFETTVNDLSSYGLDFVTVGVEIVDNELIGQVLGAFLGGSASVSAPAAGDTSYTFPVGAFFGLMDGYGATAPKAHVFKIVLEDQAGNEVDGELQVTINPAAE